MADDVQDERANVLVSAVSSLFSSDNVLSAGIVISGFGALWSSLDQHRFLMFAAFLLLGLALAYLRYPKAWSAIVWLGGLYVVSFIGMLFLIGWSSTSTWYFFLGGGSVLLGLYLCFLFVQHVKRERDVRINIEYVPLGIWGLLVFLFFVFTLVSAYGVYYWTQGGALTTYLLGESIIILSIPYILGKADKIGVKFVSAEDFIYFGEDKCPLCEARLSAESKSCPKCASSRVFQWCAICEGYSVVCPDCKQKTLWRDVCSNCGFDLESETKCVSCDKTSSLSKWESS